MDRTEKEEKVKINLVTSGKRCPICNELITQETSWNIHHIVERHKGGPDTLDNLVMLHPNCHRQIHSNKALNAWFNRKVGLLKA